jgi:hypothetical protein
MESLQKSMAELLMRSSWPTPERPSSPSTPCSGHDGFTSFPTAYRRRRLARLRTWQLANGQFMWADGQTLGGTPSHIISLNSPWQ